MESEITKKYQGIYKKAMTGRSPKAAIHIACLRCTGCRTKDIRNCTDKTCQFFKYRPYQKKPHKYSKPKIKENLNRLHTGKFVAKSTNSPRVVSKDVIFEKSTTGPVRVHISVEPIKKEKKKI